MSEFDYAKAWRDAARPAYEALPQNVRDLLAQVAIEAGDLRQLPDCSMPWPDDPQLGDMRIEGSTLRGRFDKVPAEVLAFAARVINAVGHWHPSAKAIGPAGPIHIPGRDKGATWKFSCYADQSLRARLAEATSADAMRSNGPFQVHEGAIRFCYSSREMWTWEEVAPATVAGLERARKIADRLSVRLSQIPDRERHERDNAAYQFFEALKAEDHDWPREWRPFVDYRFMVASRDAIEVLPAERAANLADERAAIIRRYESETRKALATRDAMLWCIDHGLTTDNAIFYDHTGILTFGWRDKLGPKAVNAILAVISEWPGAYEIKALDRVYRNADAEMAKS